MFRFRTYSRLYEFIHYESSFRGHNSHGSKSEYNTLPTGKGEIRYAVVAIDYFTKWAEVEPLATITSKKVLDFVVKSIICRFGLPKKIVSDNATQFDSDLFTEFCERYGIVKIFSSVAYPQANGQVEAVNKTLKASLKKRLDETKGV